MKVCIIADHAERTGGAPGVALDSAAALAAAGVAVTYLSAVAERPDPVLATLSHRSLGLADVWTRPAPVAARDGIWNRAAARRLAHELAGLPAGTILHLHQWTRALSPSAFPVLVRSGLPLVVTLHDYFLACPTGLYYRADRAEPCRLPPLSAACIVAACDRRSPAHKAVRVLRSAVLRRVLRDARFDLVHVSDRSRAVLGPLLPAGLRQHRVDNPVDLSPTEPAAIAPDAPVAFIGRLTFEKGAVLAAEAAAAAGVPVLFVGDGPAEAEIRRRNPAARLLGWQSREAVAALLRGGVRAVAAPSLWDETGPLSVYEALAAGVPAVASNRSGAAEKVVPGETGFVVEPLLGAVTDAFAALRDPDRVRRMGAEAHRRYWAAPLTPARHAEALIALYGELGDPRRPAASRLPAA